MQDFVKPSLFGFWDPALGLSPDEVAHGIEAGGDLMQSFRVANEEEIAATNCGGDKVNFLAVGLLDGFHTIVPCLLLAPWHSSKQGFSQLLSRML